MNSATTQDATTVVSNTGEICEVCDLSIDQNKPHIFAINDVMTEGPYHPECYEKGSSEAGVSNGQIDFHFDNEAHFTWPPDEAQFLAYREFLTLLQERVSQLPEDETARLEAAIKRMPYTELVARHHQIMTAREEADPRSFRGEEEELLADEIVRRDELEREEAKLLAELKQLRARRRAWLAQAQV